MGFSDKKVCVRWECFLMMANNILKPKLYSDHMYTKLAWYSDAVQMLFNNICVFTVFYNCVRFRYHHSFNLYVFTCSLNENTAHAVCTARVRFMMEQLRRSVKAAVIFYSYSIKCIIDSDIWLSHKLLPMCSTKLLTEMLTCQRLCLYCVCCYSKSL